MIPRDLTRACVTILGVLAVLLAARGLPAGVPLVRVVFAAVVLGVILAAWWRDVPPWGHQ